SLYPALHRLRRKGWITAAWEWQKALNREFKFYNLTPGGRRQLATEEAQWRRVSKAIARVMWPALGTSED
ncbi:MAG: PadR family transcriptional regulator, partial [Acidobacteria bacterium]